MTQDEINYVAEAISLFQSCSDCAGTTNTTEHCTACTKEAVVAIEALDQFRSSPSKKVRKKCLTLRDVLTLQGVTLDMTIASIHSTRATSADYQVIYKHCKIVIPEEEDDEDETTQARKAREAKRIILLS